MYNKTQLNPDTTFERHVFHRDQFAHYLRWTFVLNRATIGNKILDFGCGSANLCQVLYRNRYKPKLYVGLDIREQTIKKNYEKYNLPWAKFYCEDLVNMTNNYGNDFDIICSFEVVEHIGKENIYSFLENIKKHCNNHTEVYISTPNHDEKVGAAQNHIINGKVCEFEHDELQNIFKEAGFRIIEKFGTFASQKDYIHLLNDNEKKLFDKLKKYYDSNLISIIFAPLFPEESRNCLTVLKLR